MTATPHTVGRDQPLTVAHRLMRDHRVRHLPVVHVGKLVGLVSDRDLALIETLRDVDPAEVIVEEAMTQAPYTVGPDASLAEVAEHMAAHRYGSCVVVDGERVVGVFTTVDALEALAALLRSGAPA
ncbi:MAG: CBS domain-containing protein [Deltaproteobacteria bacterium]|nr:CBS domain-containing protein [Deltaproteobacteria bacterium]